jgi:hypothetical protein
MKVDLIALTNAIAGRALPVNVTMMPCPGASWARGAVRLNKAAERYDLHMTPAAFFDPVAGGEVYCHELAHLRLHVIGAQPVDAGAVWTEEERKAYDVEEVQARELAAHLLAALDALSMQFAGRPFWRVVLTGDEPILSTEDAAQNPFGIG